MPTMFDIAQRVASHLNLVVEGAATGGSTTTLIDEDRLDGYLDSEYFDEGTVFVVYDAGGAAAAPEKEWGVIDNFDPTTHTITFSNTLTAAIAAGDIYKLATGRFSIYEIMSAINRALDEAGDVETINSSNTTAAAQTEYTLPAANIHVTNVQINTVIGDADNLGLVDFDGWSVRKTASGSADTLVLTRQPPVNRTLYITYVGKHPNRYTSSGVIDDRLDVAALSLLSAIILLEDKVFEADADAQMQSQLEVLQQRYAGARSLQPFAPHPDRRLFTDHLRRGKQTQDLRWPG